MNGKTGRNIDQHFCGNAMHRKQLERSIQLPTSGKPPLLLFRAENWLSSVSEGGSQRSDMGHLPRNATHCRPSPIFVQTLHLRVFLVWSRNRTLQSSGTFVKCRLPLFCIQVSDIKNTVLKFNDLYHWQMPRTQTETTCDINRHLCLKTYSLAKAVHMGYKAVAGELLLGGANPDEVSPATKPHALPPCVSVAY